MTGPLLKVYFDDDMKTCMKKYSITRVLLLLAVTIVAIGGCALKAQPSSMKAKSDKDAQGHTLVQLWESYEAARAKDRPALQKEVLAQILSEAGERRLDWDFWDAARKNVDVQTSVNWKLRDSLNRWLAEEVEKYDSPIVTFTYRKNYLMGSSLLSEVTGPLAAGLKDSHHPEFYAGDSPFMAILGGAIPMSVRDDYEYALWSIWTSSYRTGENALLEQVAGRYPEEAYLRYCSVSSITVSGYDYAPKISALEDFAAQYPGKAISLLAKSDILDIRKTLLDREPGNHSDEYRALLRDVKAHNKVAASYKKNTIEGVIAERGDASDLEEDLTSKDISVEFERDSAKITMRNLSGATLKLYDGEGKRRLWKRKVDNPYGSFYSEDIVKVPLPLMDDGDYQLQAEGEKMKGAVGISRYTLSMDMRYAADGYGVFVTDYQSGEPISEADFVLRCSGDVLCKIQGLPLEEGYTVLPSIMQEEIATAGQYLTLEASAVGSNGKKRMTRKLSFRAKDGAIPPYEKVRSSKNVVLYTDRAAFNPGETLYFNLLAYGLGTAPDGKTLDSKVLPGLDFTVKLQDSEGNDVHETVVKTGEWGTADGKFTIPTGLRNGTFTLVASLKGEYCSTSRRITVDEFVLPNFEITFDPPKDIYTPGEKVLITGKVISYSGHPLTDVSVLAQSSTHDLDYGTVPVELAPDGSFSIEVQTRDKGEQWQFLRTEVKVVDNTGETQSRSNYMVLVPDIRISINLTNAAEATLRFPDQGDVRAVMDVPFRPVFGQPSAGVLYEEEAKFRLSVNTPNGDPVPLAIRYDVVNSDNETVLQGTSRSGEMISLDMRSLPSGLYQLRAHAVLVKNGKEMGANNEMAFLLLREGASSLPAPVDYMLRSGKTDLKEGDEIVVAVGSTIAPVWAAFEIYGEGGKVLEKRLLKVRGGIDEDGSLREVRLPYRDSYPSSVRMRILFFRDAHVYSMSKEYTMERKVDILPLSFEGFEDQTKPRTEYSFTIKSRPGVEVLAAIFDKSVETLADNTWRKIYLPTPTIPTIWSSSVEGRITSGGIYYDEGFVLGAGVKYRVNASRGRALARAPMAKGIVAEEMAMMDVAEESDMAFATSDAEIVDDAGDVDAGVDMEQTRDNFAKTLAFEPHLLTSDDGTATLTFTTADKLSTYVVALMAHDRKVLSSTLRRETVVSIPVKVSVVEPGVLYCGDSYNVSISLASKEDRPISGTLTLQQYDGLDYKNTKPLRTVSRKVTVAPLGNLAQGIAVDVPKSLPEGKTEAVIGMRISFSSDDGSFTDAVFVSVPLYPAEQTLTEAHSGILLPGMDREAMMERIRSSFVNVSGYGAMTREVTIIDMVREAIPGSVEPKANDVLSLSEAYYMRLVAQSLMGGEELSRLKDSYGEDTESLLARIMKCRNSDGGFAWFEGMESSPVITAVLLERFWKLHRAGLIDDNALERMYSSVKYMDKNRFDHIRPYWCGGASDEQYLFLRSMYPQVKFEVPGSKLDIFNRRMKEFKKFVSEYLVPEEDRGLQGQILRKARRLSTLMNLSSSKQGLSLAKTWGINLSDAKMTASLEEDVLSLLDYAVEHKNGGLYYPNAVMPFRGLLESEAYAHSVICDIFTRYSATHPTTSARPTEVADGLRIWLMIQKETQQWDSEPAFIDAIASVMQGSEDVKKTSVIIMTKSYRKPFTQIKAAGNGMRIERTFHREHAVPDRDAEDRGQEGRVRWVTEEIKPGTVLEKGDKIIASYKIWSEENRSFVRLRTPMEGALRPEDQLSGYSGWALRSLSVGGVFSISPRTYREVKKDRIDYYMNVCPEETTSVSETFFVTQSGVFHAPVVEIECLYSPHYRANAAYGSPMRVK